MKLKKMCAICGDTTQSNVVMKWQRHSDGVIFHVCAFCAENVVVTQDNVNHVRNLTHTTYIKELPPYMTKRKSAKDTIRVTGSPKKKPQ